MKHLLNLIFCISILLPKFILADASFEGKQSGIDRTGLELFGAQVETLAIDSSGRVYLGARAPNGIFCLESGSSEWSGPPSGSDIGQVAGVAVGASAGTAYVIGGISLFKTTDGCATWSELTGSSGESQGNNYGFQIEFGHGALLVENRDGTIDRSTDNGSNFSKITVLNGATDIVDIAASPTTDKFFALVKVDEVTTLYSSSDAGQSWSATSKSGDYVDVEIDPNNANNLALATSTGDVELSLNEGGSFSTLSAPGTSKTFLKFINSRLYKGNAYSDDYSSWSSLDSTNSGADIISPVVADPSDSNTLFVGTELGLGKSSNGGTSFVDVLDGLYAVKVHDIAQSSDKQTVYLATAQGLAKTTNFLASTGATWTFPVTIDPSNPFRSVFAIAIDRNDETKVYSGLGNGELYLSSDSASTWTAATVSASTPGDVSDIEQTESGLLYAAHASGDGNSGGVLKSSDGGSTWSDISTSAFDIDTNTLASVGETVFAGTGSDVDLTNSENGIYKYDGSSWTKVSGITDGQLIMALVSVGSTLIGASAADSDEAGGVFRSSDSGSTWSEVTSKGLREDGGWYRTLAVDPENTDIIYVAHGRPSGTAEIYYSVDQGKTWALLYTGLTDEVPEVMLVDALTVGSGVGATEFDVSSGVKLSAKSKGNKLTCTLKDGKTGLANAKLVMEKKKKKIYVRSGKSKTSKNSGKAIFTVKKAGTYRCSFLTKKSKTKKFKVTTK